jgi:uncharacterized membrane protein
VRVRGWEEEDHGACVGHGKVVAKFELMEGHQQDILEGDSDLVRTAAVVAAGENIVAVANAEEFPVLAPVPALVFAPGQRPEEWEVGPASLVAERVPHLRSQSRASMPRVPSTSAFRT